MSELFTVEEAAKELRMSVSSVHHLTSKREIGFVRLGRRIYLSPDDLDIYIQSQRFEPSTRK